MKTRWTRNRTVRRHLVVVMIGAMFAASVVGLHAEQKKSSTPAPKAPPAKTSTAKTPAKSGSTGPGKTGTASSTNNASHTNNGSRSTMGRPGATGSGNHTTSPAPMGLKKNSSGKPESFRGRDGSEARFGRDGKVREIHARGMTISHGPAGTRRMVTERPDHSRLVVNRAGHGYVQRPFLYHGRQFAARSYYVGGRPYAVYYQGYPYRGIYLTGYVPFYYYGPAFYGWAYNPWLSPIPYAWGWYGNPWYAYYGFYFSPYTVYPSASFWLTDYLISSSLQQAYQEQLDAQAAPPPAPAAGGPVVLTPEVKTAIATEVQSQIALENAESQTVARGGDIDMNSSGLPRILAETSPAHPHVFVVGSPVEVTDPNGQECGLTEGDVIRLSTPPGPNDQSAYVQVFASKNQECPAGTTVAVSLSDLQEMQNHMRATIDQGLQDLQAHQGGLPTPPPSAMGAPVQASYVQAAPQVDANAASELQQEAQQGDAAEQSVMNQVQQADAAPAGDGAADHPGQTAQPVQIELGMSTNDVVGALGNPVRVVKLGTKQIYVYSDMKITFVNGKVTDVQ